ncbi:alanine racemase [Candidatus Bandiella numerosa]|uniref:alanine racemase n=1 Tax=Candidatus Bandiella numerosa TaxID=2570586 RepID=UPI00249F0349|nr:alanine racemase [Candidatus Bandiella numerosa]WHA05125.1 alanine racemase [Candidatus Bandiella numerosa]
MLDNHQYIKVDLGNIKKNYLKLKSIINSNKTICSAVVKANAYGLGISEITQALADAGCKDFWVTNLEEAYLVKDNSQKSRIYIFQGVNSEEELDIIEENNFIPVISDKTQLELINLHSKKRLNIILNFDTGMGRDGIQIEEIELLNLTKCEILFVMSHLSCSEQNDHFLNIKQLENFKFLQKFFPDSKFTFANSGGIFLGSEYHFDMVRPGGALYGVNVSKDKNSQMLNVVEFYASVLNRKVFYKNQYVGYNATYQVKKGDKILILNVGYYDGYKRILSNQSKVYAKGFILPVIGVVSMNMIAVDANQLPESIFMEIKSVELIGEKITIGKIAELASTDQKEILTGLSTNCRKIYTL